MLWEMDLRGMLEEKETGLGRFYVTCEDKREEGVTLTGISRVT